MASKAKQSKTHLLSEDKPEAHELNEQGKRVLAMFTALEDQDGLNDWEIGFLASIQNRFYKEEKDLTPLQFEHLEKIYRKFN